MASVSRAKKSPVIREDKCGTTKGWNAHQRNDELTCADCKKAKTDYTRDWRYRTGRTKRMLVLVDGSDTP